MSEWKRFDSVKFQFPSRRDMERVRILFKAAREAECPERLTDCGLRRMKNTEKKDKSQWRKMDNVFMEFARYVQRKRAKHFEAVKKKKLEEAAAAALLEANNPTNADKPNDSETPQTEAVAMETDVGASVDAQSPVESGIIDGKDIKQEEISTLTIEAILDQALAAEDEEAKPSVDSILAASQIQPAEALVG